MSAINWRQTLVRETASVREAMAVIDRAAVQIALVVDESDHLLGVVTDGDIRRGVLRGVPLDGQVAEVMGRKPVTVGQAEGYARAAELMAAYDLRHVPEVDDDGRVTGLHLLKATPLATRDNWVVLMAGGLGQRLRPLTERTPKPLLPLGGKPLLVTILEGFIAQGFHRFFLSVNYKAEMIEAEIGDGSRWGVRVEYLRERSRLGTAGALGLLPYPPREPLIVMNGDLLTKLDFGQMLDFHDEQQAAATVAVREYALQVPYGVIDVHDHRVTRMVEKPVHKFHVNAGIYVLGPAAVQMVPAHQPYDMPDLLNALLAGGDTVAAMPLLDYWADIGSHADLERASAEFVEVFSDEAG